jgi:hydroxymethylbilane synthase
VQTVSFRLGTRKSALARVQSEMVRAALAAHGVASHLVEVDSHGDADLKTPLYEMDPLYPGVFTKHLEAALARGEVDLAVHSLKDLPTQQPKGLKLAAVSARERTQDRLLIHPKRHASEELLGLPQGAIVGTSSLRREAQLLSVRPDLKIVPLRGNVATRVAAARDGKCDAIVLAGAGLHRLGTDLSGVKAVDLPEDQFVSAPAQGVVGIETRDPAEGDLARGLAAFHDALAFREASAERAILRGMDGGCTLPLGVRCRAAAAAGPMSVRAFLGQSRDRKSGKKDWIDFHTFSFESADDAFLVKTVVRYLKERTA